MGLTKINKFLKSFFFIAIWLILISKIERYWNLFHWEYLYLKGRKIFDYEFWFVLKSLFRIDIGYYIEEIFRFLSYELPKESLKYFPIYYYLKFTWSKKKF